MHSINSFNLNKLGSRGEYAGIGSRRGGKYESKIMFMAGFFLCLTGYRVNSGAAPLSDTSFESGHIAAEKFLSQYITIKEEDRARHLNIFLPWDGFGGSNVGSGYYDISLPEATRIAKEFYPERKSGNKIFGWDQLPDPVKSLMSRNSHQIFGVNMNQPVKFVLCFTQDGATCLQETTSETGGTGQAIRVASAHDIPVLNIGRDDHKKRVLDWIDKMSGQFLEHYGISAKDFAEDYYDNYVGFENAFPEDLIKAAKEGKIDVLVHGCNIHNKMGSGFAKSLVKAFPEALEADKATRPGDTKKLGDFTSVTVNVNGHPLTIVNAYTQKYYGRDPNTTYVDYEAVRKAFNKIAKQFRNRNIGIPKIGSSLANGCWITLSRIINHELRFAKSVAYFNPDLSPEKSHEHINLETYQPVSEIRDGYALFWNEANPLSQWHPSKFEVRGTKFDNAEQFMMYQKAKLFGDNDTAMKILMSKTPREAKELGRQVSNFNQEIWVHHREKIILEGSINKFSQNPRLLAELLICGIHGKFAEASPYDGIYGIKMKSTHKDATNPSKWNGLNLLGNALDNAYLTIMNNPEMVCKEGINLIDQAKVIENEIKYSQMNSEGGNLSLF